MAELRVPRLQKQSQILSTPTRTSIFPSEKLRRRIPMTQRARTKGGKNGVKPEATKVIRSFDWRTTDEGEVALRQQRAREEQPRIRQLDQAQPIFSQFEDQRKGSVNKF